MIGDYSIIRPIEKGDYVSVYKARDEKTCQQVAIKFISKKLFEPGRLQDIRNEIATLFEIDNPFIISVFELVEDSEFFYVIMELAENGNLRTLIRAQRRLSESVSRRIFIQLLMAMNHVHNTLNKVHSDIKLENVLLDRNNNAKLDCFELIDILGDASKKVNGTSSMIYSSPEYIGSKEPTTSSDIWALGIILYSMIFGRLPFSNSNPMAVYQMILFNKPNIPDNIDPLLADYLGKLLNKEPMFRISSQDLMKHSWIYGTPEFKHMEGVRRSTHLLLNTTRDENSLAKLQGRGIDIHDLITKVKSNLICPPTVSYKILRRIEIMLQVNLFLGPVIIHPIPAETFTEKAQTSREEMGSRPNLLGGTKALRKRSTMRATARDLIFFKYK